MFANKKVSWKSQERPSFIDNLEGSDNHIVGG